MLRYYHYRKLSKASRNAYKDIVVAIKDFRNEAVIDRVTDFQAVINAVKNDNPHFFYVDWYDISYRIGFFGGKMSIMFKYTMTKREAIAIYNRFKLIAPTLRGRDDYHTVKNVHDYLAKSTRYDHSVVDADGFRLNDHTIIGPLKEGLAVCEGIARAAQFLLRELRVECTYECGYVNDGRTRGHHAWNILTIDGKRVKMDVTWDLADGSSRVSYDYFCIPA